jgi:hypothetical protein
MFSAEKRSKIKRLPNFLQADEMFRIIIKKVNKSFKMERLIALRLLEKSCLWDCYTIQNI